MSDKQTTRPPVRSWEIKVEGFPCHTVSARTAGKARSNCWREYQAYDPDCTFGKFLAMSAIRSVHNPPGVGDRILVGGVSATRGGMHGKYVRFMRDDGDEWLNSHPADVEAINNATE